MLHEGENMKIDFVIPWVDGNDMEWRKIKQQYLEMKEQDIALEPDDISKYRDWELLKYWFRSVEKYAPWVNRVHFITHGHIPDWLDVNHPLLNIVLHTDFIDKSHLPIFNPFPLEMNLHRIKDLSEYFVYFNDDMYLINDVAKEDFFRGNLPCDEAVFGNIDSDNYDTEFPHVILNAVGVINRNFHFPTQITKHREKFINEIYEDQLFKNEFFIKRGLFPGFYFHHLPQPFLKSTFTELWNHESTLMNKVTSQKFRTLQAVNQYLFRFWQLLEGKFTPSYYRKKGFAFFNPNNEEKEIVEFIENQKRQMICINDRVNIPKERFIQLRNLFKDAFEQKLFEKSSFEK